MPSKQLGMSTMQIYLNGELQHTECKNLLELVQTFALEGKRFCC